MQSVCKRYTEIPHTSKLFADLLYHFDRVSQFYPHSPFDPQSYVKAAREIDYPAERRAAMAASLKAQNGEHALVETLARPGAVAVLTGQQVGLFGGPAYCIYKALTAIQLAGSLRAQGVDAVPVFWLATEDHDFAEVASCWSFDAAQKPLQLRLPAATVADRPVGALPLESLPLDELRQSLSGFAFGEEVEALVRGAYQNGRPMAEAFADLMRRLLAGHDILFFDPMHPSARALAAPFLAKAVDAAPDLTARLMDRGKALSAAGYHAQVHIEEHTSLFFLLEGGKRLNLRRKNGDYLAKDRRVSAAEMRDRAESLSPNAVLRPVVQDYMFPTAAYVGGPAELAYLAQSEVIYRTLLGRMPVAAPRNGFTLIDDRARKLMSRYALTLDSFYGGEDDLREKIAAKLVPPAVDKALAETSETVHGALSALRGVVAGFDATLAASLDKGAAKVQYQLTKMQRKTARESLRRNQRALDESAFLFNAMYPHKHLQERFYTILPFVARHGLDLVNRIHDNVHVDCPDHHLLFV